MDISKIKDLPPMPQIAQKVVALLNDPDFSFAELVRIITKDSGITASVLKLANSSFYSPRNEIVNITQAISFLGAKSVKNLVLSLSTKSLFDGGKISLIDQKLWEHSVSVAIFSRILMLKVNIKLAEEAFIIGLLHDLGITVMKKNIHDYEYLLQEAFNEKLKISLLESEKYGFSHGEVCAELLTFWKMPKLYSDVIAHHHSPDVEENDVSKNVLFVANEYCKSAGLGIGGYEEIDNCLSLLKISPEVFEDIKFQFEGIYKLEKDLFRL